MANHDEVMPTYSVSFRIQRITTEAGFVSVPVTADLILPQADGTGRIDVKRMVERAIEMGHSPEVEWQAESEQVQPHPIQSPPPTAS
jgi:hypothetical protein